MRLFANITETVDIMPHNSNLYFRGAGDHWLFICAGDRTQCQSAGIAGSFPLIWKMHALSIQWHMSTCWQHLSSCH